MKNVIVDKNVMCVYLTKDLTLRPHGRKLMNLKIGTRVLNSKM